jgi:hypothetical protein
VFSWRFRVSIVLKLGTPVIWMTVGWGKPSMILSMSLGMMVVVFVSFVVCVREAAVGVQGALVVGGAFERQMNALERRGSAF